MPPSTAPGESQLLNHWAQDQDRLRGNRVARRLNQATQADIQHTRQQQTRILELEDEVTDLREQLSRSKALNRLVMLQKEGLIDTVRHLRKSWNPSDPQEASYKEDIKPLIQEKTDNLKDDAGVQQMIEGNIERNVSAPKVRTPRKR